MLTTMLDVNKQYVEEICSTGSRRYSFFESKPGKYEHGSVIGFPQTFRLEDSNADEKRSGPCCIKNKETTTSH